MVEPKFVSIAPEWPSLARLFAENLRLHSYHAGAKAPIAAFIDIIRYLTLRDPEEVNKLIAEYYDR